MTVPDSSAPPPGPPDKEWATTVCKVGRGADCCRYITMAPKGWSCEKHSALRETLDRRVANRQMKARGDNCKGRDSR